MKKAIERTSSLAVILLLASLFLTKGCKKPVEEGPSPAEQQITNISKSWTVESVTFQGSEDRTADWAGFTITITSGKTYSTSGAFSPGPWPASGTWDFVQDNGGTVNINKIVRDDGMEVSISVSAAALTMTFTYNDTVNNGGRSDAINGEYVFKMK
ncbi:MAG: hypothetical protein OEX02_07275 [Cyclobacteriaceae bacterium]|nr:hypothetical protein [Cyclobacteriaceae bacterium]